MEEHCLVHNKPSPAVRNRYILKNHIVPKLGRAKVAEVTRPEVAELISAMRKTPTAANHTLATLRKMFNLAELLGWRPDGTNPCRHIQKFGGGKRTRLITDEEMVRLYAYLDRADAEGLENPVLTLAIRLQFEFSARMSEILDLEWKWIDFGQSRVVWPDSKTSGMSKPISAEALRLFKSAPRYLRSRFVIPSLFDGAKAMSKNTYQAAWRRVLERAGLPHCGTHADRHRSATDIANSGVQIKVGMALTAHKTVTMFRRYIHTEDDPIRAAAETVAARRLRVVSGETISDQAPALAVPVPASRPLLKDRPASKTALGAYRPYRGRKDETRAAPRQSTPRSTTAAEAEHV